MTDKKENKHFMTLNAQYIKDLSFENPLSPSSLLYAKEPQISVSLEIFVNHIDEKQSETTMHIAVEAKHEDKTLFILELKYSGLFMIDIENKDEEEQQKEFLLYIKAPEILFPYVRRIVSDMTQEGGFPPLFLIPIDFFSLYQNRKAQEVLNNNPTVN